MSIYSEGQAIEYDQIIEQPIYKYYVCKKLSLIKKWINKESILLDVGCGSGAFATSLARDCRLIVGLDISPKMVEIGFLKAKKQGLDNTNFVVADVAHFPFRDGVFNLVFSVNLFHHVVNKKIIKLGFLEQVRCSRKCGYVLIFELNPNSLGWSKAIIPRIIRRFVYLLLYPFHQKVKDNIEEGTEMLGISELEERIKETRIVQKETGGFIPTYCPKFLFNTFIVLEKLLEASPLLKRYGAHILLVGEVHK